MLQQPVGDVGGDLERGVAVEPVERGHLDFPPARGGGLKGGGACVLLFKHGEEGLVAKDAVARVAGDFLEDTGGFEFAHDVVGFDEGTGHDRCGLFDVNVGLGE